MASCVDLPPGTGRLREAPALSLARYLQRKEAIGGAIARHDLEEVEQLLGEAFATAQAADEALEAFVFRAGPERSESHTSEPRPLRRISYAVFCWKKKNRK